MINRTTIILLCAALSLAADRSAHLFVDAVRTAKPSVVNITMYQTARKNGEVQYAKTGYGSGTIITQSGYLVTNHHVVRKGTHYQIRLADGTECVPARLPNGQRYIADEKTDIAVMKLDAAGLGPLRPIELDDSDRLVEGEWVIAIGNPYGLHQSVSSGIVSSKGRGDIGFADIEDFIQTDVPINPGNSGGPLVNLRGRMVGMNTAIRTISGGYQGISFAIPSNIIRQVCNDLIQHGRVRRGWLGFIAREIAPGKRPARKQLEVITVIKNSPAEHGGIRRGDRIDEINGKRISSLGELVTNVGNAPPGSMIAVTVTRDGRRHTIRLVSREKGDDARASRGADDLYARYGIELSENARTGDVVVSALSPMGLGYRNGLKRGDIVVSLNAADVATLEDVAGVMRRSDGRVEKIGIYRGSRRYTIPLDGN